MNTFRSAGVDPTACLPSTSGAGEPLLVSIQASLCKCSLGRNTSVRAQDTQVERHDPRGSTQVLGRARESWRRRSRSVCLLSRIRAPSDCLPAVRKLHIENRVVQRVCNSQRGLLPRCSYVRCTYRCTHLPSSTHELFILLVQAELQRVLSLDTELFGPLLGSLPVPELPVQCKERQFQPSRCRCSYRLHRVSFAISSIQKRSTRRPA